MNKSVDLIQYQKMAKVYQYADDVTVLNSEKGFDEVVEKRSVQKSPKNCTKITDCNWIQKKPTVINYNK